MDNESFIKGFRASYGTCHGTCKCGREFYTPADACHMDEGELEKCQADKATPLDWTVSFITVAGVDYVSDCDCWHELAEKCMTWIDTHRFAIAGYLKAEKERLTAEAKAAPLITDH